MQITKSHHDKVVIAEPHGRIDTASSPEFCDKVASLMVDRDSMVLLDMSHVTYISSAGFRALLVIGKKSSSSGCRFGLCGLNDDASRLFEISGFIDMFEIFPTRQQGIENLSAS